MCRDGHDACLLGCPSPYLPVLTRSRAISHAGHSDSGHGDASHSATGERSPDMRLLGIELLRLRAARRFAARQAPRAWAADAVPPLPVRGWIESRIVVLGVAAGLFVTIFVLRQTSGNVADTITLLYLIPISLVALELGLTAGMASAAFALGLVGVWALTTHAGLGAVGVFTRCVAYLAVGSVAGRFSDRMRNIQRRQ